MYEDELARRFAFRLDADVEEADAVLELLEWTDGLTSDGGEGFVMRGRVVGARDGEGG